MLTSNHQSVTVLNFHDASHSENETFQNILILNYFHVLTETFKSVSILNHFHDASHSVRTFQNRSASNHFHNVSYSVLSYNLIFEMIHLLNSKCFSSIE